MTIGDGTDHQRPSFRREKAVRAGHIGDDATARTLCDDPDPRVRAAALGALSRLHSLTLSELIGAMSDTSPLVRARIAEILALLDTSDRAPDEIGRVLTQLVEDPDSTVAETAAWAAGEQANHTPQLLDALSAAATGHPDPLCREAAIAALGAIGDRAGLAAILAGTTATPAIRRRAVIALAPFDGPEVDSALTRALTDRDWQVRQAAEDLRGR